VFLVDSFDLIDVLLVQVFDFLDGGFFILAVVSALEAPSDDCDELDSGGVEEERFGMEEEDSRHFDLVDEHSELEPVVESPEHLVLVQHQGRIQRIVVFQCILYEPLPLLYEYPQLFGRG
jgi:hypothetical protein